MTETATSMTPTPPDSHERALDDFLLAHPQWQKYRTWGDDITVASHESLTLRVLLDHEAERSWADKWTVASYTSPVGHLQWRANATARTPLELIRDLLDQLTYDSARTAGPDTIRQPSLDRISGPLTDKGWRPEQGRGEMRWRSPDGTTTFASHPYAPSPVGHPFIKWAIQGRTDGP
ncbi:DUF317 domain-containing protein [Streptomyces sp. MS19]|uniref:DUF317 domain-containing protein n=1 Tax=Streptomyces sp. MS19 TaxID=3385972 RepID=UPI0039A31E0F